MALTAKTLIACGVPADVARANLPHMARAMRAHDITTRARARAFLATVLHESMGLKAMTEIGGGSKYEGRGGLGNTHAGDGERFKGRGPIQLTGRANYEAYGRKLGLDLIKHPELVATPKVGWQVAACYFQGRGGLLAAADAGDFRKVTLLVNGGYNGWENRQYYWNKLAKLGVVPGSPDLKRGDTGRKVEVLTKHLSKVSSKKTGKPFLKGQRSKFDIRTARALRAFQKENELKVSGVLDPDTAAMLRRKVKPQASRPRPIPEAAQGRPSAGGSAARTAKQWQRLEQLDHKSDQVRASLRKLSPPVLTCAEGLTDMQLVQALERADLQSDALRKALAKRLSNGHDDASAEDLLVALARELNSVSTRISDVAAGEPVQTAPPEPADSTPSVVADAPAKKAAVTVKTDIATPAVSPVDPIAQLEALDEQADALRTMLELRLLSDGDLRDPAKAEANEYLERLEMLDKLDAESDKIRAALRRPAKANGATGSGAKENGAKARTFRKRSPEMKGEDIRRWQVFLNRTLREWKVDYEVGVDGEYGKETARWTKKVLHGLGISIANWNGLTPQARVKAHRPQRRTAHEIAAAKARREYREKLARKHARAKGGKKAAIAYARHHAELGTKETRTNGGPFIDEWIKLANMTPGLASSHWCGAFVNACLVKGGQPSREWLRYTPSIVNKAKAGEGGWSWHTSSPRVGDLVLFNWAGGDFVDHVGIVVGLMANGFVKTVEGNISDRVGYHDRKSMILGYARPPWK
ncbi:MAG TPA: CHAP domain-containing protein [Solirubrobacteraceae bacterium]|nr:CHAP domain-containing protein [Solirubrobacteraceae bacterium]